MRNPERSDPFMRAINLLNTPRATVLILLPCALYALLFFLENYPPHAHFVRTIYNNFEFFPSRPIGFPLLLRFTASWLPDFFYMAVAQLCLGLGSIIFLAASLQRLLRNQVLSSALGIALLFNANIFLHLVNVGLPDGLMFVGLCFLFGVFFLYLHESKPGYLLGMALILSVMTFLKPIAVVFIAICGIAFPVMFHRYFKAVLTHFLLPVFVALPLLASVNQYVFGHFGLSNLVGLTLMQNALFFPPPPESEHPEATARAFKELEPLRTKFWSAETSHDERMGLYREHKEHRAHDIVLKNIVASGHDVICPDGPTTYPVRQQLINWFKTQSSTNRKIDTLYKNRYLDWWPCYEDRLLALAVATIKHSFADFMDFAWVRTVETWQMALLAQLGNPLNTSDWGRILDMDAVRDGSIRTDARDGYVMPPPSKTITAWPFQTVSWYIHRIPGVIAEPHVLIFLFGCISIVFALFMLFLKGDVPPVWLAFSLPAITVATYAFLSNIVNSMDGRFWLMVQPLTILLLFSPLQALKWTLSTVTRNQT